MPEQFISTKGCVIVPSRKDSQGWYRLDGLDSGSEEAPILVLGAQVADTDIVFPMTAIGDIQIVTVFGRKIGDIQILGTVLCGTADTQGDSFGEVVQFFQANRVSKKMGPTRLSMPGGSNYNVLIHGLGLSQPDGQYNVQPFIIYGMIASPPKGE